jgi:hypothetical protein
VHVRERQVVVIENVVLAMVLVVGVCGPVGVRPDDVVLVQKMLKFRLYAIFHHVEVAEGPIERIRGSSVPRPIHGQGGNAERTDGNVLHARTKASMYIPNAYIFVFEAQKAST